MLTVSKQGIPIAIIRGGYMDKKIIKYLDEKECMKLNKKEKSDDNIEDLLDLLPDEYIMEILSKNTGKNYKKNKSLYDDIDLIKKNILGLEEVSSKMRPVYREIKNKLSNDCKKEIVLRDNGIIYPMPFIMPDQIENIYICGQTGSGKSTFMAGYVRQYKRLFPKRPVWLFSRLQQDKVLDEIGVNRILIDEDLLDEEIELETFTQNSNGALVLFDDCNTISDKKLCEKVYKIRDDLSECGRHKNISICSTSHMISDYKKTRNILNESSAVVFFKGGTKYHIIRFLKTHAGLNKNEIEKILNLPSRWIYYHKSYPNYILYEKGAYLL